MFLKLELHEITAPLRIWSCWSRISAVKSRKNEATFPEWCTADLVHTTKSANLQTKSIEGTYENAQAKSRWQRTGKVKSPSRVMWICNRTYWQQNSRSACKIKTPLGANSKARSRWKERAKWSRLPEWCGFTIKHTHNANLEPQVQYAPPLRKFKKQDLVRKEHQSRATFAWWDIACTVSMAFTAMLTLEQQKKWLQRDHLRRCAFYKKCLMKSWKQNYHDLQLQGWKHTSKFKPRVQPLRSGHRTLNFQSLDYNALMIVCWWCGHWFLFQKTGWVVAALCSCLKYWKHLYIFVCIKWHSADVSERILCLCFILTGADL